MHTNTDTTSAPVWSAEELYDSIMREIEPDLTTAEIETIDSKYPNETEDEHKARLEQYALAFVIFDETLEEFQTEKKDEIREIKNEMQKLAEQEAHQEDEKIMNKLEQSIDSSEAPSA